MSCFFLFFAFDGLQRQQYRLKMVFIHHKSLTHLISSHLISSHLISSHLVHSSHLSLSFFVVNVENKNCDAMMPPPYVKGFVTTLAERPDVVLCNGPGTCIPLCAAAFVLRVISPALQLVCPPWWPFRKNVVVPMPAIVYVESIARVASLSLSGKLLYHLRMADAVYVQWEGLQRKYPRTIYAGRIM